MSIDFSYLGTDIKSEFCIYEPPSAERIKVLVEKSTAASCIAAQAR